MAWRRIQAEGCEWEVRAVASEAGGEGDMLEFQPLEKTRPIRRLAVPSDALATMDDAALHAAFVKARPIGAEHYGRPGKRMTDMNG
jgi:hypothetical protein